jgi:hypothetical protein
MPWRFVIEGKDMKYRRRSVVLGLVMAIVALVHPAYALRSSSTQSYTDPDFKGYQPKKLLLVVMDASPDLRRELEERASETLGAAGLQVVPERELFPPTREWTPDARKELMTREGIDASLVIGVGRADSSVIPFATNTFSNARVSGYGSSATVTGNSTSYNMYAVKSQAEFSAVIMTVAEQRIAWYADISTKASGAFFVGEKGDAKAVAKEIAEALAKDGHLVPRKREKK